MIRCIMTRPRSSGLRSASHRPRGLAPGLRGDTLGAPQPAKPGAAAEWRAPAGAVGGAHLGGQDVAGAVLGTAHGPRVRAGE